MPYFGRAATADDDLDRYYTPPWPTVLLMETVDPENWGPTVAEPCAGRGDIVRVLRRHGREVVAGDLDPATDWPSIDARSERARDRYRDTDAIVTNPPYSSDAGAAEDVIGNLLRLDLPTAALLPGSWAEPCSEQSERGAWFTGDELRPSRIIMLTRVEYEGPALDDSAGNPGPSAWFIWNEPGHSGETRIEWRSKADEERARGQTSLLP